MTENAMSKKYRRWFYKEWRKICKQLNNTSINWNKIPITASITYRNPPERRDDILGAVELDEDDY